MKNRNAKARGRILAATLAVLVVLCALVLPAFAIEIGGMNGNRSLGHARLGPDSRTGENGVDSIVDGVESAVDNVTDGMESAVDDLTDIPNGTGNATEDANGADGTNDNHGIMDGSESTSDSDEGLMGDEVPEDGTNIPDDDIGGAIEDSDKDGTTDPTDKDDDNDGVLDSADPDADGDGMEDDSKTAGIVGIIIAVIIVIAIIVLVIAVMPKKKK